MIHIRNSTLNTIKLGDILPYDFVILLAIISKADEKKERSFFYEEIKNETGASVSTVKKCVDRLIKNGFLKEGEGKRTGVKRQFYQVTTDLICRKIEKPLTRI